MRFFGVIVFFIIISFSEVAFAQSGNETGNTLLEKCTSNNVAYNTVCTAYISGVTHGALELVFFLDEVLPEQKKIWELSPGKFCLPTNSTRGQVKDVVVKYLQDNPKYRDAPASYLILKAIKQAWPCN